MFCVANVLLFAAVFLAGLLCGFVLHVVLTNRRILRRGYRPEDVLGA